MEFRISDSFTDSLARLTNDEQKAVKTTAFDLQIDPTNPGMQFHRLDRSRDANFWSVRVSRDLRIIIHRTEASLLLCFVAHHDDAYNWAERRKLETHPKTGAAQIVEVRETVREITVPVYIPEVQAEPSQPPLFTHLTDEELLDFGVPAEWLPDVKNASEDSILEIADHLPSEAAEAVLELAVGGRPEARRTVPVGLDPFEHPDAQRRFRVMNNVDELEQALEYPWEKWTVFLHPAQRELVERDYTGPARVSGSAGTGKTIVALHRAVFLARKNPDARVLLATFSDPLANALRLKVRRLISNRPQIAERLDVLSMHALAQRLYEANFGRPKIATKDQIRDLLNAASDNAGDHGFSTSFLVSEWEQVVDAWQLESWDAYRDVARLGRRTRLPETQRAVLWSIFEDVRNNLGETGLVTEAGMLANVSQRLSDGGNTPYDFAVLDEAQDVSVGQLRMLAALGGGRPNGLFFAGDLGQRIFQQPFSWKSLGVDVRGRARTLRINYRTSHQIRMQADRLLGPEISDVDGLTEDRRGTISVFNGPVPEIAIVDSQGEEIERAAAWIDARLEEGLLPQEIGLFVRSENELQRAIQTAERSTGPHRVLDEHMQTVSGSISIGTMHMAKGLEFRAVVVMACDDEVVPLQSRIESVVDDSDLEEVYNTERHLLYVACTRARDHLLVSGVDPASEFLDDLVN